MNNTKVDIDKLLVSLFNMTPISKENKYLLQEALKKQGLVFNGTEITSIKEAKERLFNAGDWVVYDGWVTQIVRVDVDGYVNSEQGFIPKDREDCMRLWDIEDAKSGDVLSDGTTIFIFKDLLSDGSVMSYCDYDADSGESDDFCPLSMNLVCSKITPTTKEQRDTLIKAMADAGYTFDFDKKELKKIEQSAWSKEDEKILNRVITNYESGYLPSVEKRDEIIEKLKSLKDRYTWKPSEEQIKALEAMLTVSPQSPAITSALLGLYEQLKKLKGE